jgi:hypothetical protein
VFAFLIAVSGGGPGAEPFLGRQSDRAFARFQKNLLDRELWRAHGDIVMLIVRQPSRSQKSAASPMSLVTWSCGERLFGGYHNVSNADPTGGSRIAKPMSQILEPLTRHPGSD